MVKAGQYYRNIKEGGLYLVEMLAIDVTDYEMDVVVYSPLYNSEQFYVRELGSFIENFEEREA